jgi:halocyanin-like protein
MSHTTRRKLLTTLGATAVATVAGCSEDGPVDGGNDTNGGNGNTTNTDYIDEEPDYGGWFDDVSNYEGTVDMTGESEVTVMNGTGDIGQQFDPPAIAVDAGTTVVWEWTGQGGSHNVVGENADFESELTSEEGFTFEQTFEESGVTKYFCRPHRAGGMKGAVYVP